MDFSKTCFRRGSFSLFPVQFVVLFFGLLVTSPTFASWTVDRSLEDVVAATEVQILHVTSDAMPGFTDMKLSLDADFSIVSFRYITDRGEIKEFNLADLDKGVVLYTSDGRDVIKLIAKSGSPSTGAALDLVYLSNGISGSYETFRMDLVRMGNSWALQVSDQAGRREFTSMFLKARKFLGKVIGIQSVTVK